MELDQSNLGNFIQAVMPRPFVRRSLSDWTKRVREAHKFQQNPLKDISLGHNQLGVFIAPPQSAKTGVSMSLIMLFAVMETPLATILATRPKLTDLGRFQASIDKFQEHFKYCAEAVGCPNPPTLKAFGGGSNDRGVMSNYSDALSKWDDWLKGNKETPVEIPVFLVLQTSAGLGKAGDAARKIERVLEYVDETGTGARDAERIGGERVRSALVFDEGDMVKKGSKDQTAWSEELAKLFVSCRESKSMGSRTLLDVVSALVFVTATPQALVTNKLRLDGREFIYCDLPVSENYVGYEEGLDVSAVFKTLHRRTLPEKDETGRGIRQQFYDYVTTSDKPIAAMVYTNHGKQSNIAPRTEEARKTAVNYSKTPRFLTCPWSSGKLDVFTSSTDIKEAIGRIQVLVKVKARRGVAEETVATPGFFKLIDRQGVTHYEGKGITEYPLFVTKVIEALRQVPRDDGSFKSILFGHDMVDRGVPVCASNHQRHLDCALVEMFQSSHENLIQVCGRLCAVLAASVAANIEFILFAPAYTHRDHISAIDTTNFCTRAFATVAAGGKSVREDLASMRQQLQNGQQVEDKKADESSNSCRRTSPGLVLSRRPGEKFQHSARNC